MPRPAGSANKNKKFLMGRLQEMYGEDFHPIMNMAKNAHEFQLKLNETAETCDKETRGRDLIECNKLWSGIAEYVEPKLKAVEITGKDGGDIGIDQLLTVEFVGIERPAIT